METVKSTGTLTSTTVKNVKPKRGIPIVSIISFVFSGLFIIVGFHKMLVYSNPDSYLGTPKNVYVGGDAYNYIINSNYSTAFFVLAGVCVIFGGIFIVKNQLESLKTK